MHEHPHHSHCQHHHGDHGHPDYGRTFMLGILLNAGFVVIELIYGFQDYAVVARK